MKYLLSLSLSFLSVSCIYAQKSDIDQIKQLNAAWLNSYPKKDTATLDRILADDYQLISPRGVKLTKDQILRSIASSPGSMSLDLESADVRVFGNTALLTAYATSTVIDKNNQTSIKKNCYSDLFVKRNGVWQAVATDVMIIEKD